MVTLLLVIIIISEVSLCSLQLVLRQVIVQVYTIFVFNQATRPGHLSVSRQNDDCSHC